MKVKTQSMVNKLRSVLVKSPVDQTDNQVDWQEWGFSHKPDTKKAIQEHKEFVRILKAQDVDTIYIQEEAPSLLDSIFTYDPALITSEGAIMLRSGKERRQDEAYLMGRRFLELDIPIIYSIRPPGTVDGGDTLWLDSNTLVVGNSFRTNKSGISQLRKVLEEINIRVVEVQLPYYGGPEHCFHLLSIISLVDNEHAVFSPKFTPVELYRMLRERGFSLIEAEEDELGGCNILTIEPGKCVMLSGYSRIKTELERIGFTVLTYKGEELFDNREGGPSCLVRPLLRE